MYPESEVFVPRGIYNGRTPRVYSVFNATKAEKVYIYTLVDRMYTLRVEDSEKQHPHTHCNIYDTGYGGCIEGVGYRCEITMKRCTRVNLRVNIYTLTVCAILKAWVGFGGNNNIAIDEGICNKE